MYICIIFIHKMFHLKHKNKKYTANMYVKSRVPFHLEKAHIMTMNKIKRSRVRVHCTTYTCLYFPPQREGGNWCLMFFSPPHHDAWRGQLMHEVALNFKAPGGMMQEGSSYTLGCPMVVLFQTFGINHNNLFVYLAFIHYFFKSWWERFLKQLLLSHLV